METIDERGRRAAAAVRAEVRPYVRDVEGLDRRHEPVPRRTPWWTIAAAAVAVLAVAVTAFVVTRRDSEGVTDPADSVPGPSTVGPSTTAEGQRMQVPPSGIVLTVPAGADASGIDTAVYGLVDGLLFDDGTLVRQAAGDSPIEVREPDGTVRVLPTQQGEGVSAFRLYSVGTQAGRKVVLYGFVPTDLVDASYPDGEALELHTIGADGTGDTKVFRIDGGAFLTSASMVGGLVHVALNVLTQGEQYLVGADGLFIGPIGMLVEPRSYSSADGTVQAVFAGQRIQAKRIDGREVTVEWGDDRPTVQSVELDHDRMIVNIAEGAPFLFDGLFSGTPVESRLPGPTLAAGFVQPAAAPDLAPAVNCTWASGGIIGDGAMGSHYSQISLVNSLDEPCIAPMVTGGALMTANGLVGLRFDRDLMATSLPPVVFPGQSVAVIVQTSSNYDVCGATASLPAPEVRIQLEGQGALSVPVSGEVIDAACGGAISQATMPAT